MEIFFEKKSRNFFVCKNKYISLHSQTKGNGSVAQLNRASDYGSEGYRFESCRSHQGVSFRSTFFYFRILNSSLILQSYYKFYNRS